MPQANLNTLLVTGGAGFIGSCFVREMVAAGRTVIVLDRLTYAGHRENLEGLRCELVVGDIADSALVGELLRRHPVDAVVNFAAESHVDRSISGPAAFIETNIQGTFNLLSESLKHWLSLPSQPGHASHPSQNGESRKQGFRFLQISTDEVYGSLGATGKFSETTPYAPNSPYSASKASADMLVRAWHHTYGLPTITTNCSNNYGPRQYPEKLIPLMITHAVSGKPLPVYGDGGNVRDWIHVEDHCRGIWLALERGRPGETYCFGGNAERGNLDVVRTICRELDLLRSRPDGQPHETAIAFVKDRLGHDRRYAIDDALAQRELGFTRKFDFEHGLADTIRWYLENDAWCQAVIRHARSEDAATGKGNAK
jgi:dTDP-glucose 4,6-dehydratase